MNVSKLEMSGLRDAPEVLDSVGVISILRQIRFCHNGCDYASCSQNSRPRHMS